MFVVITRSNPSQTGAEHEIDATKFTVVITLQFLVTVNMS